LVDGALDDVDDLLQPSLFTPQGVRLQIEGQLSVRALHRAAELDRLLNGVLRLCEPALEECELRTVDGREPKLRRLTQRIRQPSQRPVFLAGGRDATGFQPPAQ